MSKAWMPLYIGDYLGDTGHLTLEQHGAYLLLIMHYWQRGGLPSDDASLKRILGLHSQVGENRWRSICLAIAPLFSPGWKHKRIDRELKKFNELKEKRAMAGRKGGQLSRSRNNLERHANQAIAKQMGGQSHKNITTTFLTAAKEESGTAEREPVAAPRTPSQNGALEASPELQRLNQRKGWVK